MKTQGWTAPEGTASHSCGCVGPQNGQPLCPCRMRGVTVKDGRYVEVIDHGPVSKLEGDFMRRWAEEMRDAL